MERLLRCFYSALTWGGSTRNLFVMCGKNQCLSFFATTRSNTLSQLLELVVKPSGLRISKIVLLKGVLKQRQDWLSGAAEEAQGHCGQMGSTNSKMVI